MIVSFMTEKKIIAWEQVSRVVNASALGVEVTRFDPVNNVWRSWEVAQRREGAELTVEAQEVKSENTISVGHCVIP